MAYTLRDDQFWPTGGVVAGPLELAVRSRGSGRRRAARALDPLVRHPRLAVRPGRARLRDDAQHVRLLRRRRRRAHHRAPQRCGRQPRDRVQRRAAPRGAPARSVLRAGVGGAHDRLPRGRARRLVPRAPRRRAARGARTTWTRCGARRSRPTASIPTGRCSCTSTSRITRSRTPLRDGRAPSPDVDDALRAHALVEAAYRSAAERRPVDLAELDL